MKYYKFLPVCLLLLNIQAIGQVFTNKEVEKKNAMKKINKLIELGIDLEDFLNKAEKHKLKQDYETTFNDKK